MKHTIILTEQQLKSYSQYLLKEELASTDMSSLSLIIKKYLDDNFTRTKVMENGEYDIPSDKDVVVPKRSSDNKNVKPITDEELFYILQSKFKSIFNDSTKRDQFIKKVIPAWYYKRIDNNGIIKSK
jgi:hypothetical protein